MFPKYLKNLLNRREEHQKYSQEEIEKAKDTIEEYAKRIGSNKRVISIDKEKVAKGHNLHPNELMDKIEELGKKYGCQDKSINDRVREVGKKYAEIRVKKAIKLLKEQPHFHHMVYPDKDGSTTSLYFEVKEFAKKYGVPTDELEDMHFESLGIPTEKEIEKGLKELELDEPDKKHKKGEENIIDINFVIFVIALIAATLIIGLF